VMSSLARRRFSYKYNRLCHEIGDLVGKQLGKPTQIWLKLTHRCKTQCVMCNIWKNPSRPSEELSTQEWRGVLDDIRTWLGPYEVGFTGGEAFARKDLIEILTHSTQLGLYSKVVTRGVGVYDEHKARAVLSSGLNEYHMSLESLKPEIHDAISPPRGNFAKAFAEVTWLKELRKTQRPDLKIIIKTIITNFNYCELVPMVEWVSKNKLEITFQPLIQPYEEDPDMNWFKESKLWPSDEAGIKRITAVLEELVDLKKSGAPILNSESEFLEMKYYFLDPIGRYGPARDHNLKIAEKKRRANNGYLEIWHTRDVRISWKEPPIGNVKERHIWEIWKERPLRSQVVVSSDSL